MLDHLQSGNRKQMDSDLEGKADVVNRRISPSNRVIAFNSAESTIVSILEANLVCVRLDLRG
jgi:hypothetical protein